MEIIEFSVLILSYINVFVLTDQQILQMSQFHAGEHSNQLPDQSMDFDNSFLEGAYTGLPNDVHLPYQDYSMPSSSSTMFNVQTSSWPPDQLFTEEATRMLSSIHLVSANASETANPKAGAEERWAWWSCCKEAEFLCVTVSRVLNLALNIWKDRRQGREVLEVDCIRLDIFWFLTHETHMLYFSRCNAIAPFEF